MPQTVFVLSPAHCGGKRAQFLFEPKSDFPMAQRLRQSGAPIGDVFAFLSGLYFRGKLTYARAFQQTRNGRNGVLVIVPGRGLVAASRRVTLEELKAIAAVGVTPGDSEFEGPFARDARRLARRLGDNDVVVLLGSVATAKYTGVLQRFLGERLHFPPAFVGRGDMSRGGLLLRSARQGSELSYVPVEGAILHGIRPAKLGRPGGPPPRPTPLALPSSAKLASSL